MSSRGICFWWALRCSTMVMGVGHTECWLSPAPIGDRLCYRIPDVLDGACFPLLSLEMSHDMISGNFRTRPSAKVYSILFAVYTFFATWA